MKLTEISRGVGKGGGDSLQACSLLGKKWKKKGKKPFLVPLSCHVKSLLIGLLGRRGWECKRGVR